MTAIQTTPGPDAVRPVRSLPRRIPCPATEPPYDDEVGRDGSERTLTDGALALDLATPPAVSVPAARHEPATDSRNPERHLRVVGGRPAKRRSDDPFFAPQPTPRVALPDPHPWSGRFVQALVEVLSGDRPATQLLRWTNEHVYSDVVRRVRSLGVTAVASRGRARAQVRSVHIYEPRDGVAEAAIHVRHGGRSRAVAMRLEGLDGRWRCTALSLG
jgi:Family of unknown function (DUF6459)